MCSYEMREIPKFVNSAIAGRVKEYSDRKLVMRDGTAIPVADIVNLDGRVFETLE